MTYKEKAILQRRLERAEYRLRFQIAHIQLIADEIYLKADKLFEQADLLAKAQKELWEIKLED